MKNPPASSFLAVGLEDLRGWSETLNHQPPRARRHTHTAHTTDAQGRVLLGRDRHEKRIPGRLRICNGNLRVVMWLKEKRNQAPALQRVLGPGKSGFLVAGGVQGRLRREIGEAREGGDEFLRVRVLGRPEDLRRWAAFNNFAGVQNGDAMAKGGN